MLTTQRLKELFDYSSGNGELTRLVALSRSSKQGQVAGWISENGYIYASVDNKTYPMSHLVWMWHGNPEPIELDHINHDGADNRIENLRSVTRSQNMWNTRIAKNNTSGIKGVSWKKDKQKYRVRIGVNGKRIHIGDYADLEMAKLVVIEARAKYHGNFSSI